MKGEDTMAARRDRGVEPKEQLKRKREEHPRITRQDSRARVVLDWEGKQREGGTLGRCTQTYIHLNSPLEQVPMYVWDDPSLKWLVKLKTPSEKIHKGNTIDFTKTMVTTQKIVLT